jgi:hypothetical protein
MIGEVLFSIPLADSGWHPHVRQQEREIRLCCSSACRWISGLGRARDQCGLVGHRRSSTHEKLCGKNQGMGRAALGNKRNVIATSGLRSITGTSQTRRWVGILVVIAALLLGSAGAGHAWGGGHGFGGHGFHHVFHDFAHFHDFDHFQKFGGPRIGIGIGPFWGPYWRAYPYPYAYPPVVVAPPPVYTPRLPR